MHNGIFPVERATTEQSPFSDDRTAGAFIQNICIKYGLLVVPCYDPKQNVDWAGYGINIILDIQAGSGDGESFSDDMTAGAFIQDICNKYDLEVVPCVFPIQNMQNMCNKYGLQVVPGVVPGVVPCFDPKHTLEWAGKGLNIIHDIQACSDDKAPFSDDRTAGAFIQRICKKYGLQVVPCFDPKQNVGWAGKGLNIILDIHGGPCFSDDRTAGAFIQRICKKYGLQVVRCVDPKQSVDWAGNGLNIIHGLSVKRRQTPTGVVS